MVFAVSSTLIDAQESLLLIYCRYWYDDLFEVNKFILAHAASGTITLTELFVDTLLNRKIESIWSHFISPNWSLGKRDFDA